MKKTILILLSGAMVFMIAPGTRTVSAQTTESSWQDEVPDWLKRTDYGFTVQTGIKPNFYLETVQPLYQSDDKTHTVFTHDRLTFEDSRGKISLGLGYRRLLWQEQLMAGVNSFFDYQELRRHHRQGVGLELIGKVFEARTNAYFAISPKRLVESGTSSTTYERAADGFDVEIGAPIPYVPWVKLFGSYYTYDYKQSSDVSGWKLRGEVKPFKAMTINLEAYDDNKGSLDTRLECRFRLAFSDFTFSDIMDNFKLSEDPFPGSDLTERTLDRVERNFEIQIERYVESGGITVQVGRR